MKKTALIALLSCAVFAIPSITFAEAAPAVEKKEEAPATPQQVLSPEQQKKAEKHIEAAKKASDAVNAIGKDLKGEDARHFFTLYNNYNLLATVKMVQVDVGNAIKSCGEKNPDLSGKMNERFQIWDKAVGEIIAEAQGNNDNMIVAQEYAKPEAIKDSFKLLDEARDASNAYIDKTPVTTEDACNHLLEKMDETQESLTSLLRRTLMSYARSTAGAEDAENAAPEKTEPEKAAE